MFSAVAVGILVALSTFAWVYTWTMRRTGNNSKSAMITAGIAALFVLPPLAILSIPIGVPIGIWTRRTGKRYVEMGEAMNEAAGRENYMRHTGMPSNRFLRGWANGPDTRFYPVMDHPPVQPVWA